MQKASKFLGFVLAIFIILAFFWLRFERLRFDAIVIHHSASTVDNYRTIADYHLKEKGWRDAAYHLIISNGSTEIPLGFLEATRRYQYLSPSPATKNMYYNLRAIHICVVGNYDKREMPVRLQEALADTIRQLQEKFGIADDHIFFHRDCSSSSCPGSFITKEKLQKWLTSEADRCPKAVKIQHEKCIGTDWGWVSAANRALTRFSGRAFGFLGFLFPGSLPFQPIA